MKVIDALACVDPYVGDHTVAAVERFPHGQASDDLEDLGEDARMRGSEICDQGDMLPWDHQEMSRRLGVDVSESHHPIRAVNHIGVDGSGGDPTEGAVGHGCATSDTRRPLSPSALNSVASTGTIEPYSARPSKKTRT